MLSDQQLRDLIAAGENEKVEFKSRVAHPDLLARLLAAFANTEGGTILIGVDERTGIVGCSSQQMMRVFNAAIRRLKDGSHSSMYFHRIEGKEVAVISVAKAPRVVSTTEGMFVRRGEAISAMTADEIRARLRPSEGREEKVDQLIVTVTELTKSNQELRDMIIESNSWRSKSKDYVIGGAVGAALGFLLSLLAK